MKTAKVKTSFQDSSDDELDQISGHVTESLTGNATFTDIDPPVSVLVAKREAFVRARHKAVQGSVLDTAEKDAKKEELQEVLHDMATDVNKIAKGDRAKLLSSGFELVGEGGPVGQLAAPAQVKPSPGSNPGEIVVKQSSNDDARVYVFHYCEDPMPADGTKWTIELSTRCKITLKGLKSGQKYWFKCAAKGSDGTLVFSAPLSWVSQ